MTALNRFAEKIVKFFLYMFVCELVPGRLLTETPSPLKRASRSSISLVTPDSYFLSRATSVVNLAIRSSSVSGFILVIIGRFRLTGSYSSPAQKCFVHSLIVLNNFEFTII